MVVQIPIQLKARSRGFHIITSEVLDAIAFDLPKKGILHLFIQHTSAGLCINENADPTVLSDFALFFNKMAPENLPGIQHTLEGADDMPAHIKAVLTGHSVQIPIVDHTLALGTWQGIYLCEFRNRARSRTLLATLLS